MQGVERETVVKESYIWRGSNALAFVSIQEEPDRTFRGNCSIVVEGETVSKSTGGQYNIGNEWTDPGRAVNDLAVILFHEVHKHSEIQDPDELAENIARGKATASSSHDFRHDPADDLIRDLRKYYSLVSDVSFQFEADEGMVVGNIAALDEAISLASEELVLSEENCTLSSPTYEPDPFFIPETGPQMELFG